MKEQLVKVYVLIATAWSALQDKTQKAREHHRAQPEAGLTIPEVALIVVLSVAAATGVVGIIVAWAMSKANELPG